MKLVSFNLTAESLVQTCFEWVLAPDDQSQVGCHMNTDIAPKFKHLLCLLIQQGATDKKEDPEEYCRELKEMPGSKQKEPEARGAAKEEGLSRILMDEASKE